MCLVLVVDSDWVWVGFGFGFYRYHQVTTIISAITPGNSWPVRGGGLIALVFSPRDYSEWKSGACAPAERLISRGDRALTRPADKADKATALGDCFQGESDRISIVAYRSSCLTFTSLELR